MSRPALFISWSRAGEEKSRGRARVGPHSESKQRTGIVRAVLYPESVGFPPRRVHNRVALLAYANTRSVHRSSRSASTSVFGLTGLVNQRSTPVGPKLIFISSCLVPLTANSFIPR